MVTHGMLVYVPGTGSNGSSRWFTEGWGEKGWVCRVEGLHEGCINTLSIWNTNRQYSRGVGERVADTNRAVQFCIPFGHQGNRTRRRNPLKPSETNSIEENAESRALSLSTFLLLLYSPLLSSRSLLSYPLCRGTLNVKEIGPTLRAYRYAVRFSWIPY